LKGVVAQRATQRKRRHGRFRVALVGYTNAGKSSVLRRLSGDDLFVEDRLFATLDPATRQVDLGSGYSALVTDTVGFIRKLPHHLVASFRSTLEEAREADLLLHVIDLSHRDWEAQKNVVDEVLEELELADRPRILLFNKVDRLTHDEQRVHEHRARALGDVPAIFVSAVEEGGLDPLVDALRARVRATFPRIEMSLPAGAGEVLATVHREGEVLSMQENGTRLYVTARVPEPLLGRLRQDPEVELAEP
jgi:GTP-binding protein HflX